MEFTRISVAFTRTIRQENGITSRLYSLAVGDRSHADRVEVVVPPSCPSKLPLSAQCVIVLSPHEGQQWSSSKVGWQGQQCEKARKLRCFKERRIWPSSRSKKQRRRKHDFDSQGSGANSHQRPVTGSRKLPIMISSFTFLFAYHAR